MLDLTSRKWSKLQPLHTGRDELALVFHQPMNAVFAIGGCTEKCCLNSVEAFEIESGQWIQMPSLSVPRTGMAAVSTPAGVLAIGGYNGEYLNSVELFDHETQEWTEIDPMKEGRAKHAACLSLDE